MFVAFIVPTDLRFHFEAGNIVLIEKIGKFGELVKRSECICKQWEELNNVAEAPWVDEKEAECVKIRFLLRRACAVVRNILFCPQSSKTDFV